MQIRGLTETSACLLAEEIDALGIAVRTGVPVDTSPLAGIDPREVANPASVATGIRTAISDAGLASRLGPKVSVVVDGRGQVGLGAIMADVRLVAVDASRWRLSVAGDEQAATFVGEYDAHAASGAAVAILQSIAALGRQARARDLNPSQIAAAVPGSATPHSIYQPIAPTDSSPIGILPLTDDRTALGIALPFGSIDAATLIAFCEAAIERGATGIRPAHGRTVLVLGLDHPACDALTETTKTLGFVTAPADPRIRIAACPGAPACASGMIAARDVAAEIAQGIGQDLDPTLSLHVSGCAKGCAHPGPAALTIVGDEKGAAFVVGGTAKGLPAGYTAGYEAALGAGRLVALVAAERRSRENATACLTRLGAKRLARTIAQG
ncbi:precorrin-3B synthase [Aminobacter sp. UC22_36]|uniref:precorrin-3B synthase n=1 Tax=Aminobacter sp. UC22_36 TaxID=3374549 RepID=UPI0037583F33